VAKSATPVPKLLKISELGRVSGVPAATVKHYVREGLVTPARTGRNIAYFEPGAADRIRRIKDLQQNGFLPLKVIKRLLDGQAPDLADTIETVRGALTSNDLASAPRNRSDLLAAGLGRRELDWLERLGVVAAIPMANGDGFGGDDLELLRTLGAARKAGITSEMLPMSILGDYFEAIQRLVKIELSLFREGVLPRAGADIGRVTEAATRLSERLVVLLRRRLIVPTLREMAAREPARKRELPKPRPKPAANPQKSLRPALTRSSQSRK
jgi:DNA-binding transcriptional MerR regulator